MKVLVACEESGCLRRLLRERCLDAWSCDLLPAADDSAFHFQRDVRELLGLHWDAIIAFPPYTDLCVSGARWFAKKHANGSQQRSIDFFMLFAANKCPRIAIENPVGIMSSVWRKPDQIIQPWQFGHGETKATCLWLKGLPKLVPTNIVEGRTARVHRMPPGPERAKLRSRTYDGIAEAMATQWFK